MIINSEELKDIKLFDIPTGKQSFIATIQKVVEEDEMDYYGKFIPVPYVYLKNIKILIDKSWFNIDCSNVPIRSKIGKRLEKLNLESEDMIAFDAKVESADIEFYDVEGIDDINYKEDEIPFKYLPKEYDGLIKVEMYETEFSMFERISKCNYEEVYDRKKFTKKYKTFYHKTNATDKKLGFYREPQAMYYRGKLIKNLSNIEKF